MSKRFWGKDDTEDAMRFAITAALLGGMYSSFPACAADNELAGTYRLVVEQRTIVDTGEIVPVKNLKAT